MQLVSGQCLEHGQHGSSLSLCDGQVHVAVVAALHLACAGAKYKKRTGIITFRVSNDL